MDLRILWCDVDDPKISPPILLPADPTMTVKSLQDMLHKTSPGRAPAAHSVRLFCQRGPGRDRTPLPALSFLSRPEETIASLQLQPDTALGGGKTVTIYWASNLMKFQEEAAQASLLPQIDEEIDKRLTSAAAESAMATARELQNARDEYWALPQIPWPSDLDPSKMRFYWSEENQYHMGESILLQLMPDGEFRKHEHSWSDGGNRTSHRHSLVKGSFRLVLTKERGTYTLHMMPARKWASYKPPVKWEDDAEFSAVPRETADPLPQGRLKNGELWVDGHCLKYMKG